MELATLFVSIHCPKLGETYGQIAIRPRLASVYLAVVWAVHGLQHENFVAVGAGKRLERILAILLVVAGSYVQRLASNVRRYHRIIACLNLCLAHELLQALAEDSTF